MHRVKGFFALAILSVSWSLLNAQTIVGGLISTNTTWNSSGNPYVVTVDLLVDSGITLQIDPGTIVKFDSAIALVVRGTLRAIGDASNPILFTSNKTNPQPGDWGYIQFDNESQAYDSVTQSGCQLSYCTVEYAGYESFFSNFSIGCFNSCPLIEHSTVKNGIGIALKISIEIPSQYLICRDNTFENMSLSGSILFIYSGFNSFFCELLNDTIRNCLLDNYQSKLITIGDMFAPYGKIVMSGCVISNNLSGLGIFIAGTTSFTNNLIFYNTIIFGNESYVVKISGTAIIKNNLLCRNSMPSGLFSPLNGILVYYSSNSLFNIRKNVLSENRLTGYYYSGAGNIAYLADYLDSNSFIHNSIVHNYIANGSLIYPSFNGNLLNNTMGGNIFDNNEDRSIVHGSSYYFNFHNNNFTCNSNNGTGLLYFFETDFSPIDPDFDATSNWWGTSDSITVADGIYDYFDNLQTGVIDYSPFLTQPDTGAPVSPPCIFTKTDLGGGMVKFDWLSNPESDIAGYRIYWDTLNCFSFANSVDVGNVITYTMSGADFNKVYALTAYDNNSVNGGLDEQFNGYESWFTYDQTFNPSLPTYEHLVGHSDDGVRIFPNPFTDYAHVVIPFELSGRVTIQVFDDLGRVALTEHEIKGQDLIIKRKNLQPGIYLFKVLDDEKIISTGKLIVE